MTQNCGNCKHGRMVPQDFSKRICRGAPPQIVVIPASPTQISLQHHWPLVDAKDEGCGMHKPKITLDDAPVTDVKQ